MTEFTITLVDPSTKRLECRRGHLFVEGSFRLKRVIVRGKPYIVRDCILCNRLRQSQYQKRKRAAKKFTQTAK